MTTAAAVAKKRKEASYFGIYNTFILYSASSTCREAWLTATVVVGGYCGLSNGSNHRGDGVQKKP